MAPASGHLARVQHCDHLERNTSNSDAAAEASDADAAAEAADADTALSRPPLAGEHLVDRDRAPVRLGRRRNDEVADGRAGCRRH